MDDRNNSKRHRSEDHFTGGGNYRERSFGRRDGIDQQRGFQSSGNGRYDRQEDQNRYGHERPGEQIRSFGYGREGDPSQSTGYERQADRSQSTGYERQADRSQSTGYERQADRSQPAGYEQSRSSVRSSDRFVRGGSGNYHGGSGNSHGGSGNSRGGSGNSRGGSGNYRGGRGGFSGSGDQSNASSSFNREGFHKSAGGDYGRMPESGENKQLLHQQMPYGTEGTSVELISNFYKIVHSDIKVYHYDIEIVKVRLPRQTRSSLGPPSSSDGDKGSPNSGLGCSSSKKEEQPQEEQHQDLSDDRKMAQERFIKKFADKILSDFVSAYPNLFEGAAHVYDGWKNVYTTKLLSLGADHQITEEVGVSIDQKMATFKVTLKLVDRISMSEALEYYNGRATKPISERLISVFESIIRFVISKSYATYQRKFFDLQQVERSPKAALVDFVQGFINSVRMTEFGLALNVHLKTSAIISKSYDRVLSLVCDVAKVSEATLERGIEKSKLFAVNKILRHLKIVTRHGKRSIVYSIDSLVDKTPKEAIFEYKGKKTSVHEYFKKEYDIRLKSLPMVRTSSKNVHMPLELCYLQESQFLNKTKFDTNIQRELLFKSTHQPNVYFHKLARIMNRIKESDTHQTLQKFGMDISPKAARIQGRVLPAPRNLNSNNREGFYRAASPPSWAIFTFDLGMEKRELERFKGVMIDTARRNGLRLSTPAATDNLAVRSLDDVANVIDHIYKKTNVELLFIGIPSRHEYLQSNEIYSAIKQCCDQKYGIMTQCFQTDKARKIPPGYFDNFLLKVNGKVGGLNSALDPAAYRSLPFNPTCTMMVGIDVNHPGETEQVLSSVAAAVGSYDSMFSLYNTSIRVQRKERDEMVMHLDDMISELLEQYYVQNKKTFPDNLIVFRDGVSDGQFEKVVAIEIPLIRRAAKDTARKNINLTFIIVQKRHHARFALAQQNTSARKPTYNVPSGTVVDRGIVDPHLKVFYLNSHFSPLGTSKPTKYVIIQDDLHLSSDDVQKLCFYSCYNSIRTRNVIAIPTAVRYADLCAYRSKMHIEAQRAREDSRSSLSHRNYGHSAPEAGTEEAIIRKLNDQARLHERVKHRLFYC